jgi:CheY-like chemotaxis protein
MRAEHDVGTSLKLAPQKKQLGATEKLSFPPANIGKGRKPSDLMMCRLLLIYDRETPLDTFRFFFTQSGYHVETATSGEQGIQKLDAGRFDLVITDVRPRGIDGSRIARHIRNSGSRYLPIIAISPMPMLRQFDFDLVISNPLDIVLLKGFLKTITSNNPSRLDLEPTSESME